MTKKSSRSKSRRSSRKTPAPTIQISLDIQLDILGYALLAVALLTLLALVSAERGQLLGPWVDLLSRTFGWGVYLVPFFVGAVGLYLVLRRFGDRIPRPQPEQVVGVLIIFVALLVTIHFPTTWLTGLTAEAAAAAGYGGGALGAGLGQLLLHGLGGVGTALALTAGWIVGVFFVFGVSPAEMLRGLIGVLERWRESRRQASAVPLIRPRGTPTAPTRPPQTAADALQIVSRPAGKPSAHPALDYTPQRVIGGPPWQLPRLEAILEPGDEQDLDQEILRQQARIIEETLNSLGAPGKVREVSQGPVVTQFGVEPGLSTSGRGKETRVKVSKIASLADDLALALSAKTIRIEAPVPRKGLVGIEVPNPEVALVALYDIVNSESWTAIPSSLRLALGQDVSGAPFVADLRSMPHLLIAGTTGSGKSVCINSILAAFLLQNTPDDLKLLMVDPKRVELTLYDGIPHLLAPVIVDVERVVGALQWVLREMDGRYRKFANAGARDIVDYNQRLDPEAKKLPYIVVFIDELADLMMLAPQETERAICRLAQMARATGIHLIIATQRPSVDVVTGLIKANFPARIAFAVASTVDSRVILDMPGAERLLGRGDMLFVAPDSPQAVRLQGAFVSDAELHRLVDYWKSGSLGGPDGTLAPVSRTLPPQPVQLPLQEEMVLPSTPAMAQAFEDDLLPDVLAILLAENRASISLLQRKLRIGYTRSARIMDLLDEKGVVGPPQPGGQTREVNRARVEALLRYAGAEPPDNER